MESRGLPVSHPTVGVHQRFLSPSQWERLPWDPAGTIGHTYGMQRDTGVSLETSHGFMLGTPRALWDTRVYRGLRWGFPVETRD